MDYNTIFQMDPSNLLTWLLENFSVELPEEIQSTADMENAAKLLLQLSNHYSYLCALASTAKIATRNAKRYDSKEEYEDMVDRKEIIQNMVDVVKQQYAGVSRAVTIRMENNVELRMTAGGYISQ